ncbi:glycosyltransferase family 2 protein [Larkinella sp. VNQ87]|uniref:glycosyltransferase family 2 protein n=1 Tax=Larkinella sp. VNQ87 TaxID=3400921 RepID=UPI003C0F6A29
MITVTTVIPTYNRKKYLQKMLDQLLAQHLTGIVQHIVIVVDGSSDGTLEMLRSAYPQVQVVLGTGDWWYTKSMNAGFQKALQGQPDYILCLNDDVEIGPEYVATLVHHAESIRKPAIVGSVTASVKPPHPVLFSGVRDINWLTYSFKLYQQPGRPYNVNDQNPLSPTWVLPGRGMLINRQVMNNIGLFDEKLVQYSSDDEYCLRAIKLGFQVCVCWLAVVFSNEELTGEGSVYKLPAFLTYLSMLFNRYSPAYLKNGLYVVTKYGKKWALPITYTSLVAGSIYTYFKYRLKRHV